MSAERGAAGLSPCQVPPGACDRAVGGDDGDDGRSWAAGEMGQAAERATAG